MDRKLSLYVSELMDLSVTDQSQAEQPPSIFVTILVNAYHHQMPSTPEAHIAYSDVTLPNLIMIMQRKGDSNLGNTRFLQKVGKVNNS